MPVALVHLLEPVEVEEDQRELAPVPGVPGDFRRHPLVQGAVVADPGQLVAPGQRPERFVARAQAADQEDDADPDGRQAGRLGDRQDRLLGPRVVAEDQRRQQPEGDREQRRQQVGGTEGDEPLSIGADARKVT